jgi:hypothetical protein
MNTPFVQLHPGLWAYRPEGQRRADELRVVLPEDKHTFRVLALDAGWFREVCPTRFRSRAAAQRWVVENIR